jgi:hypothetical protein
VTPIEHENDMTDLADPDTWLDVQDPEFPDDMGTTCL